MKKIFGALDTSNGISLAVADEEGAMLLNEQLESIGRDSDRILAPWVMEQLESVGLTVNDVTHWTVGIGPGSFAGLRCGIAMVKGFALVSRANLRGVPSSVAIAAAAHKEAAQIGVLHEGRCGQVLFALLERTGDDWKISGEALPLNPEQLLEMPYKYGCYAALKDSLAAQLPEAVQSCLTEVAGVDASWLLRASADMYPWCDTPVAAEKSTEPLYVRQAVFVRPATLRAVQ